MIALRGEVGELGRVAWYLTRKSRVFCIIIQIQMDIKDYDGVYKYKLIVPLILVMVSGAFTCSFLITFPWFVKFCCIVAVYSFVKTAIWGCSYARALFRGRQIINKYEGKALNCDEEKVAFIP